MSILYNLRLQIRKHPFLHKLLKFGVVGFTSAFVSLSVSWLISLSFPQFNLVGKAIGYIIGFFVGFTLNKIWTYVDRTEDGENYLLKYSVVYAATFVVYLSFNYVSDHVVRLHQPFYWVVEGLGMSEISTIAHEYDTSVSNFVSIIINAVLNFLGTNFLVFRLPKLDD